MTQTEFEKVMLDQFNKCEETLNTKAKEYAEDDDRLHNFKQAAGLMQCSDQYALGGMLAKHMISIYDMIQTHIQDYPMEQWNEKITDAINYLVLLKAVVSEALEPVVPHKNQEINSFKLHHIDDTDNEGIDVVLYEPGKEETTTVKQEVAIGFNFIKCFEQAKPGSCVNCKKHDVCAKTVSDYYNDLNKKNINSEEVEIEFNFEKCFEQTLPRSCDGCTARKECAKVIRKSIDLEKLNYD